MSEGGREPFSPDFRYEVIVKTLKEIANSELVVRKMDLRDGWNDETTTAVQNHFSKLFEGILVFSNPSSNEEEKTAIEESMFLAIMYLKAADFLHYPLDKDKLQLDITRIDLKQDALSALMRDILSVLTELVEKIESLK